MEDSEEESLDSEDLNDTITLDGPGPNKRPRKDGNYVMLSQEMLQGLLAGNRSANQDMKEFFKAQTETMKKVQEGAEKPASSARYQTEDKVELVDRDVRIKDDGHKTIDVAARALLGKNPNNANVSTWWRDFPRVTKPRLSHSLQYSHITGSYVCRETVWKLHDRGEFLTLKNFSPNNSAIICKVQKTVTLEGGDQGEIVGTADKDWKEVAGITEAKEAVRNLQVLTHLIRNYDYGPTVIGAVLDKVFWFSGKTHEHLAEPRC